MQESDFRTARQLLELLRAKLGGVSDYRLAKVLGMSHQGISTVMINDATLSDENAVKLALELGLDPVYVIICMNWQRAKDESIRSIYTLCDSSPEVRPMSENHNQKRLLVASRRIMSSLKLSFQQKR